MPTAHDAVVVDAAALVLAFTDATAVGSAARERLRDRSRHAPHLVDAEVGNVLRRMALRGELPAEAAARSRAIAAAAVGFRYRHTPLAERAWELRENVTFYDGLYVALAERLGCPLITVDARLHGATGPRCAVELFDT